MDKWYVVQVFTGKEDSAKALMEQFVGRDLLRECFVPRCKTMKKIHGEWVPCENTLIPGYLIAVTSHIDQLERALNSVPVFAKLLSNNESFVPLSQEEQAWMESFTQRNRRVIEMSTGVIESDQIIITEGPLANHTGLIKKIDRHKRIAYLNVSLCGRSVEARVGLQIVSKA